MMQRKKTIQKKIKQISLDRLTEHPMNANTMSEAAFRKLVRNIERTNFYEPFVVRRHSQKYGFYQIISGHQRARALRQLGYKKADCIIRDFDDEDAKLLLASLNRLTGKDKLEKKRELICRLSERVGAGELSKIIPYTKGQIEKLCSLKMPQEPAKIEGRAFAKPVVFFVSEEQSKVIEEALAAAEGTAAGDNRAVRRGEALVLIAQQWKKEQQRNILGQ